MKIIGRILLIGVSVSVESPEDEARSYAKRSFVEFEFIVDGVEVVVRSNKPGENQELIKYLLESRNSDKPLSEIEVL